MKYFIAFCLGILLLISSCSPLQQQSTISDQQLHEFTTSEALTAFLRERQQEQQDIYGPLTLDAARAGSIMEKGASIAAPATAPQTTAGTSYSQTNVQVEGVDEADIVKNDGRYIYTLTQNKLVIVDAYPPATAKILSTLDIPGNARDLFINKNRLVVFTDLYQQIYYFAEGGSGIAQNKIAAPDIMPPQQYEPPKTGVLIYDLADKSSPILVGNSTVEGSYYQSRMIGDYVYVIAQNAASYTGGPVPLPALRSEDKVVIASPVSYFDNWEPQINFNSIATFNLQDVSDVNLQTFMMGYANTLYVSENNLYIAYQKQVPYAYYQKDQESRFTKIIIPLLPQDVQTVMRNLLKSEEDFNVIQQHLYETLEEHYNRLSPDARGQLQQKIDKALQDYDFQQQEESMKTVIHRFSLQEGIVRYEDKGEIPGTLLNQFSLDEYDHHLRAATTVSLYSQQGASEYNNVYVLNERLKIVGKLEHLAEQEKIYSARFMGERLYLVTFKQVDPLFVIDLSHPENPSVLGKLKIPGFSNYLHPYDATHILGLGQDTIDEQGRTITNGLKLALFDVSDVENPKQEAFLTIGKRGTYSEVFSDHKAFLFDPERQLIIFPVNEVKDNDWQHVWQGAYVIKYKPNIGFVVAQRISHGEYRTDQPYDTYSTQVRRALYIEHILYTLSPSKIEMNNLNDFKDEYKTIRLPYKEQVYGPILY